MHSLRLTLLVLATALTSCGVPTTSRWDRTTVDVDGVGVGAPSFPEAPRFRVERAPTVDARQIRSRIVPAVEREVTATFAGRIEALLTSTGSPIDAGQPVIEWSSGNDPVRQLRIDILELEIALAELEERGEDVDRLGAELAETRSARTADVKRVLSPDAGVLGRFGVSRFTDVEVGDVLFTVGDPDRLRVDLELTGAERVTLQPGDVLQVAALRNPFADTVPAVITSITEIVDETTADDSLWSVVASLEAVDDTDDPLVVGDRVDVEVAATSGDSLRVATAAVQNDGRGPFVMVAEGTSWRRVEVETGIVTPEFTEIRGPLNAGATVVAP